MHIGQAIIATAEVIGQLLMIEAEQMEHRSVKVMDMDFAIDGGSPKLIGGTMGITAANAAAGKHDGEATMIMVSSHSITH
jgi:hypothetical protein